MNPPLRSNSLASIIILNYNYARFLKDAIDSALGQTYTPVEVLVVDDGSTDESRRVILEYGDAVLPIFKENGGQASGYNVGFARSSGDSAIFMDSDDFLLPNALQAAVEQLDAPEITRVHWPALEVDEDGRQTGRSVPSRQLPEGDLRDDLIREGPYAHVGAPCHGYLWPRTFLERVLPIPERSFRRIPDGYLRMLASLLGEARRIEQPNACYRVHSANYFQSKSSHERHKIDLVFYERCCDLLSLWLSKEGLEMGPEAWKGGNDHYEWMRTIVRAFDRIVDLVPAGRKIILVDENQWAYNTGSQEVISGLEVVPFLERDGVYWGAPADDAEAIAELERLCRSGARHIGFGPPAFWWLDHFNGFRDYLYGNFECVHESDYLILFTRA